MAQQLSKYLLDYDKQVHTTKYNKKERPVQNCWWQSPQSAEYSSSYSYFVVGSDRPMESSLN